MLSIPANDERDSWPKILNGVHPQKKIKFLPSSNVTSKKLNINVPTIIPLCVMIFHL